jgi:tRNA-dihydrouridine synthase
MQTAEATRAAYDRTGATGVMLARGSLGNPWLFEELLGRRHAPPSPAEILGELDWVIACAVDHLGAERAARYLRKFYPWYLHRLGADRAVQAALQATGSVDEARAVLRRLPVLAAAA